MCPASLLPDNDTTIPFNSDEVVNYTCMAEGELHIWVLGDYDRPNYRCQLQFNLSNSTIKDNGRGCPPGFSVEVIMGPKSRLSLSQTAREYLWNHTVQSGPLFQVGCFPQRAQSVCGSREFPRQTISYNGRQ